MTSATRIHALITRLARLDAAGTWSEDLNPAQIAALDYLSRANRFSRAPSHVADYLGTTRGTMSQTLKSLERKGYVAEIRSQTDRRSISYKLTETGVCAASRAGVLESAIARLDGAEQTRLETGLARLLTGLVAANGGRAFGICQGCAHHRVTPDGAFCALLSMPLEPAETRQICHEQVSA